MCAIDGCEPFADHSERILVANVAVSCTECYRTISMGELYQYIRGLIVEDEYHWEHFRTCRHCCAAGAWLHEMCGGYPLCMLADELEEHYDEYPSSTVLEALYRSVINRWDGGADPVPDEAVLRSDAERCFRELTAS